MKQIRKNVRLVAPLAAFLALTVSVSSAVARIQHDIVIDLDPNSSATFSVQDHPSGISVTQGRVSFEAEPVVCEVYPCTVVLNSLSVLFSGVNVGTNYGTYQLTQPTARIDGPITLVNTGAGYWIPEGTPVTVATYLAGPEIDDGWRTRTRELPQAMEVGLFVEPDSFYLNGTFDFSFNVDDQTIPVSATAWISGLTPFLNTAPSVDAFEDQVWECQGRLPLDGSAATDREENIYQFEWDIDNTQQFFGEFVYPWLANGEHAVTVGVLDAWGGYDETSFSVSVYEPAPTFSTPPIDVVAYNCGSVTLGPVVATSPCGEVAISNDAPATFKAGKTVVTWTATSPTGLTTSMTQLVWVSPGDDPLCCPAGSNVIVGTSNDDNLVGTAGVDCIIGLGAQDTIDGLGGDDIISAGDGDDSVIGGSGNDVIFGGSGQDVLLGVAGDDGVFGGAGDDKCSGDVGNDFLDGGEGNDRLAGGAGANTCVWLAVDVVSECTAPATTTVTTNYSVCTAKPEKCSDCTTAVAACQASAECETIIECVASNASCNQPHECSATCEVNRSAVAVQLARSLASCFGGI